MKNNKDYTTKPKERVSYWVYFVGQNVFYNLVTAFLATYLALVGISLAKIAVVMLIVKAWDAVNDPLFGVIFDKVKFKSGNKSLPWLRISIGLIPITTILIFVIPSDASDTVKLFWFGIAYMLWDTAYTLCDVPIFSMVTTMTANLDERNTLMSLGRLFSSAGGMLVTVIATYLISDKVGLSFATLAIVMSVAGFLLMLPLCIIGKERNYIKSDRADKFTFKQVLAYLKGNKYLAIYYIGFALTAGLYTTGTVNIFAGYYLFGDVNFTSIILIISAVPSLIMALLIPAIVRKIDKFKLLVWANIAGIALGLVMYFIGYYNKVVFLIFAVIRAVPLAITAVINFMFTADCAEYGHYKTGIDAKGIAFSIQTFAAKFTAATASAVALFALSLFGWKTVTTNSVADLAKQGVEQTPVALNGLWVAYILIPVIGMILSAICYIFYKLNDKDVQVMAKCNSGEITRDEADKLLSRKY